MKKNIRYIVFLVIFFFLSTAAFAEIVNEIVITGNKRIQSSTIIEYGKIKTSVDYSVDDLNSIKKQIYETGFFEKINLSLINNKIIINVLENPLINFYSINIKNLDYDSEEINKLYNLVKLGPNKIFSEYKFQDDLNFLKNWYFNKGYTNTDVVPRISKLEDNKVNILISINKNQETNINRIYFIGDKKFDSSDLKSVLISSEYSWWKLFSKTSVSENLISYDKAQLKKFYLNNGYRDVQIPSVELKKISADKVDIVYNINAGPLYQFGNFSISEGKNLINNATLEFIKELENKYLKNNYSVSDQEKFVEKLTEFFGKKNIEFLSPSLSEIKEENKINLLLNISEVQKVFINKIDVSGNSITEENVIRQNIYFSEGDSYIYFKIKKSIDKLKSLAIFSDVKIIPGEINNGKIDIVITVTEKPTGTISASAGYGSNGGMLGFAIGEENFLGKNIRSNINLNLGTQKIEGKINLSIPDFMNSDRTLFANLYSNKTDYTNTLYESKKQGLDLGTRYEIFDNIFFRPGYGFDYEKIDVNTNASAYYLSQDGNYLTQRINYNIEMDEREQKYKSKNGYTLGLTQELASFGSDTPYFKNSFYGANYFPTFSKQSGSLRYGYSNITNLNSNDHLKLSDRLFVPNSYAKGFEPRAYGPLDTSSNNYIGGNNAFYSIISSNIPTPIQEKWNLNISAFLSAFDVWGVDNNSSINDANLIRSAYGIVLDYTSPIGPISMSFSNVIKKLDTDKERFFNFELGTVF